MAGTTVGEAFVKIRPDTTGFESDAKQSMSGVLAGFATGFAAVKVGEFFKSSMMAASDFNESASKAEAIFGKNSDAIRKWADGAVEDFGATSREALESAASFGNMFLQMDIGGKQATQMSKKMVELAADFNSFHNPAGGVTEVLEAQQAAFRGEYDAVQKFVPTINAAAVEQKALAMTGKESNKELTAGEKAAATYALMLQGAGKAVGDFDRTNDSAANQMRKFEAGMVKLQETIGAALLPMLQGVLKVLQPMVRWLTEHKAVAIALAAAIGVMLVTALGAWVVGAVTATLANLKLAASYALVGKSAAEAGTGMAGAAAAGAGGGLVGMLSGLGAMAGVASGGLAGVAAGLGVAAVAMVAFVGAFKLGEVIGRAIFGTTKDYTKALDEETKAAKAAADVHGKDLVDAFKRVKEASRNAMDAQGSNIVVFIRAFKAVAKESIPAAEELLNKFKDQPRLYNAAKNALAGVIKSNERADQAARAHAAGISVTQQAMEDLNNYIRLQADDALNLENAQISMEQSIKDLGEALRNTTLDTLEGRRAFADTKGSIESWGNQVFQSAKLAGKTTQEATQDQINSLGFLAGTLAPGSPLRTWLEGYIDKLRIGIPSDVTTNVNVNSDDAEARLKRLLGDIQALLMSSLLGVNVFVGPDGNITRVEGKGAEGAIVNRPTLALIGEAGPEAVVPLHKVAGNQALPKNLGGVAASGGDTFHIYTVATEPVPFALEVSRRMRREMFLAGR